MTTPTITYTTPTPDTTPGAGGAMPSDYPTARTTPIVVQVTYTGIGALELIVVTVQFIGGAVEIAYMGGSFIGEYVGSSFQVSITNGLELHLIRTDGWPGAVTGNPSNKTVQINVTAISTVGTSASSDALYQMPPSSSLPPVISVPSTPIPTAADFAAEAVSFLIWQFRS